MKHLAPLSVLVVVFLLGFSCTKEKDFPKYDLSVHLIMDNDKAEMDWEGIEVLAHYHEKDYTLKVLTDKNGVAHFEGIEAGAITLTCSFEMIHETRLKTLNATREVNLTNHQAVDLEMILPMIGDLVIKQFYYSGSATITGKLYAKGSDQFIEIYNNTSKALYADGLSIMEYAEKTQWPELEDSFVVAKTIFTIPGAGQDVPIKPGESLVLAIDGFDHRTDALGNPNSPVDLGNADFEFYVQHDTPKDLDYHGVPNLLEDFFVYRGNDVVFDMRGGSSIALVWLPKDRKSYIDLSLVERESGNGAKHDFCKIPNAWVEDAVHTSRGPNDFESRFAPSLDAGFTYVVAGIRSGLCVRRKIDYTENGITYYQDTNNSTNDFERDVVPVLWE